MDNIQPIPFLDASTVLTFLEEDADQNIDAGTLPPIQAYLPKGFFLSLAQSKILSLICERSEPFPCDEGVRQGSGGTAPSGSKGGAPGKFCFFAGSRCNFCLRKFNKIVYNCTSLSPQGSNVSTLE